MPPKKDLDPDLKKGDVIQAVVIADPFNTKFGPLKNETHPKCLLPLANRPMLAYTLDFLKGSGVQEVILYCTDFAPQMRKYLAGELDTWREMVITTLGNEACTSLGDALRDLDSKGLLRSDFILISGGDTISNVNLLPFLEKHKQRCLTDKNCIMTTVYMKASPGHHCRSIDGEFVVATSFENQLLHHTRADSKNLNFPLEIFAKNDAVELRYDLLDSGIAICTHEVPPLFSDNFDCQTMDDFVKGTLESDLTDHTIYVDVIDDRYAARAHNMLTYMAITRDVLHRYVFPIVPDQPTQEKLYWYSRNNIYKAADTVIKRNSVLEEDVIIGPGSVLGENSTVSLTTIGQKCNIGNNVSLRNCILHDKVKVGNNCQLVGCIVGSDVIIGDDVVIHYKSVLGPGVEICSKTVLESGTRLVAEKSSSGFSDDDEPLESGDANQFGPKAFIYESDEEDENSGSSIVGPLDAPDPWGAVLESGEDDFESSADESDMSVIEEMVDLMLDDDSSYNVFYSEVLESLQRGAQEGVKVDNLTLEVNSSRHAYAVTPTQVIQAVMVSILTIGASKDGSSDSSSKLLTNIKNSLKDFKGLIVKYVKSQQNQLDCLLAIASHVATSDQLMFVVGKVVHYLYDVDVLSDDAIVNWFETLSGPLKDKIKPLVDWLQQSDSDSDDDDESD